MNNSSYLLDKPRIIVDRSPSRFACAEGQCDACASTGYTTTTDRYAISSDAAYILDPFFNSIQIDNTHHYVAWSPRMVSAPLVLNHSALALARHFSKPRPSGKVFSFWSRLWGEEAVREILEQMIGYGVLVSENCTDLILNQIPTMLTAWLHITDRCNLRCSYCYLPHNSVEMSCETARSTIDATFRSAVIHDYQRVKLKYAGGEALTRFPFVAELHRYALEKADQYGLTLDGVILSNGTLLTTQIVNTMQALGLRLTVSLDGLVDHHRFYQNGEGTACDVIKSIDLAIERGLVPEISITVSGRSVAGLSELMAWVLKRNLPFRINFYRESDFSASLGELKLEKKKIVEGMLAAFQVIETHMPHRSLLASLVDQLNLATPHLYPCGVGQNYLVFDCGGNISKCQMDIERQVTSVEVKDPINLIRTTSQGIQNFSVEDRDDCRQCDWKYWCAGGCPLAAYRATGYYNSKSPNCTIYKELFPEVLRLEGLRLLRYCHGPRYLNSRRPE
jgi:uncharacterized protein